MTNRQRGDYLERQTKAALEAKGWAVTRAAGSLGAWDLMAMKDHVRGLLIACKTNGVMPPAERTALLVGADIAGATPLCAFRASRGVVGLRLVTPMPTGPLVAELRTVPREKLPKG